MLRGDGEHGQVPLVVSFGQRPAVQERGHDRLILKVRMRLGRVVDYDVRLALGKNALKSGQNAFGAAILLSYTGKGDTYPSLDGFRVALIISAALGLITAVLSFVLSGRDVMDAMPHHAAGGDAHGLDDFEVRMQEEALLEAGGAMLVDELDLKGQEQQR